MATNTQDDELEWVPLRIFMVWHPSYSDGLKLAKEVHAWFGGPDNAWHRAGLGIPVMFWTSGSSDALPAPIPTASQAFTVVVPLVDEHFAALREWRDWIEKCVPDECHVRFWAVHPAAFRIGRLSPVDPLGTRVCTSTSLRRLLTESCALLLIASRRKRVEQALSFFISYARKDGAAIASDVRHALLEYGNVQVFMDVHDIEPGQGWQRRLMAGMDNGAAMIAVVTDEYSVRAWCRRELHEYRKPVRDADNHWWLRSVFVLDALSGQRVRSMFEVGNATTLRWQKDSANTIIDSLVRDVLFGEVQRLRASRIQCEGSEIINWVPDLWTINQLQAVVYPKPLTKIVYPGDGLPQLEMEFLREVLPNLQFQSFEEVLNP